MNPIILLKLKAKRICRKAAFIISAVSAISSHALAQAPNISYGTVPAFSLNKTNATLVPTNSGTAVSVNGQTVTIAGHNGIIGTGNGTGTGAYFFEPTGVALDPAGNLYVADYGNNLIRKITPAGVVTTVAGTGAAGANNGPAATATFYWPMGICLDAAGNIYVAEKHGNLIRKITPDGMVSTYAGTGAAGYVDGPAGSAEFNQPADVKADAAGNIYVADYTNCRIRMISPSGMVSTLAGSGAVGHADGQGTAASFNAPVGIAFDPRNGNMIISDQYNNLIRVMTPNGTVTTLAGQTTAGYADGLGTAAQFNTPRQLCVDASGTIYVADGNNNRIRKITPGGSVTTLAGNGTPGGVDGPGGSAEFQGPFGVTLDATGNLYIGDYTNPIVRQVAYAPYSISGYLPQGLNFNAATGIISGTPAAVAAANTFSVIAYGSTSNSTTSLSLAVNPSPLRLNNDQNYIITYTPKITGISSTTLTAASGDANQVETSVEYFDGLGRPLQNVQVKGSPQGNDIIQPIAFDQYGREVIKYLPYAAQSGSPGSYRPNALVSEQSSFFTTPPTGSGVAAISYPSAQTVYESSPLNRPLEQGAPGAAWQPYTSTVSTSGHTVKLAYTTNNSTAFSADSVIGRQVARYDVTISANGTRVLAANGYYSANTLSVTVSNDENWAGGRAGTVEEYKDMQGHVVLKRQYNYRGSVQLLSTYYIYDDLGNLALVLPPAAGGDADTTISQTTLDNFCYQYRYDERNRLSGKKVPGKGWEYLVYNQLDQPVLNQDSLQRVNNQWTVTKYDALGRTVMTGLWNAGSAIAQSTLQTSIYGGAQWDIRDYTNSTTGYRISSYPAVSTVLSESYYDDYNNIPLLPAAFTGPAGYSLMTRGLLTATRTAVLNTPADMLASAHYYDDLGRHITDYQQHYLGGILNNGNYDVISTKYNFVNQPTVVIRQHWNTGSAAYPQLTSTNAYLYDQAGRKIKTWEQLQYGKNMPTAKTLVSQIDYNEIGQVFNKHLHSTDSLNFLQNIAYTYNERGWLTASSAPLFAMQLYYNTGTNKAWNGNIMYQYWVTSGNSGKNYTYTYDALNRLLSGKTADGKFMERGISYDLMGNINTLSRVYNGNIIDSLAYNYLSGGNPTNQLQSVNDKSPDAGTIGYKTGNWSYAYDGNGNIVTDNSKGISGAAGITYNLLNLPQTVTLPSSVITYTYDAAGNKLRRKSTGLNNTTDYMSGIQYDSSPTSSDLFIQTEEGRADYQLSTGGFEYQYYLGDNLGNTRVTFGTKGDSTYVYQKDDYYPFGMEIMGNTTYPKNEYLYNKKELQEETQEYDYGARYYDPVIARWTTVDRIADHPDQVDKSPYIYVWDDPIGKDDPDGNCPNCLIGAAIGAVLGGGIEAVSQLYHSGHITSWRAVGGSALQGAITGGVAGATGGTSLLANMGANAAANVVGGFANRSLQGKKTTLGDVAVDAAMGGGFAAAGRGANVLLKKGLDKLSNSAKGTLGETVTKIKWAAKGYISDGEAVVPTGRATPAGKVQVAKYDHNMTSIFTKENVVVESKFNSSGLTGNQRGALKNVKVRFELDRTTSQQLSNGTQAVVTGTGGQMKRN